MPGLSPRQKKKIEKMLSVQKSKMGWNFYNERQHVETLFYNRFNYFLMLYGFFIAAIVSLENAPNCTICSEIMVCLLSFSIIILSLVWTTLCRNYQTLCIILHILDEGLPEYHSSPILSINMEKNSKIWHSRDLMAIVIPFVCIVSLCVYLAYLMIMGNALFSSFLGWLGVIAILIAFVCFVVLLSEVRICKCRAFLDNMLNDVWLRANAIK